MRVTLNRLTGPLLLTLALPGVAVTSAVHHPVTLDTEADEKAVRAACAATGCAWAVRVHQAAPEAASVAPAASEDVQVAPAPTEAPPAPQDVPAPPEAVAPAPVQKPTPRRGRSTPAEE